MKKLAKRNKINVMGITLLFFALCIVSLLVALALFSIMFSDQIILGLILDGIFLIICIPLCVKKAKELNKILKLLNSKSEYYLEIYGDNIKVNALDGEYTINFKDIERLNYSYDRPLICANLLFMYGNHKYKLNTNSEKSKSSYVLFDLSSEYIQALKNGKKTKHGLLLITTKDYFFVLPEIENVEECFMELKTLINYIPTTKENEKKESQDYIEKLYENIMARNKNYEKTGYNEKKFIELVNMLIGISSFDIEKNIQYLEELGATNYSNLLKNIKLEFENKNSDINAEDFAVELFNRVRLLDEQEPFYTNYLIHFAKENLSNYIK